MSMSNDPMRESALVGNEFLIIGNVQVQLGYRLRLQRLEIMQRTLVHNQCFLKGGVRAPAGNGRRATE